MRFLARPNVAVARLYVYEAPPPDAKAPQETRTRVTLALKNDASAGLGEALPSGRVALMAPAPGGAPVFAGGDHLDDTPVGLPFEIALGLDSQVQARVAARTPAPHAWTLGVQLTNAGEEPALVELRQPRADDIRITAEDRPHRLDRGRATWRVLLPPHASLPFHYAYSDR